MASAVKLPRVPESAIQKSILDYLRMKGIVCKRNNAGLMFSEYKGRRRAINVGEAGWPDIIGLTKGGTFFGIEVKGAGGVVSEAQREIGDRINASGGIWFVAFDLADVIARGF